jgi:GR25 family glycosyltransferase involved in LPS biosynthesis
MENIDKIQKYIEEQELILSDIELGCEEKNLKVGIFVINLKHRSDKLEIIKKQLDKLKIFEYTVVDAVYGESLSDDHIKEYADIEVFNNILDGRNLTKSEIGCSASHNEIYKKIVAENYSHAIVFEDDVIIKNIFVKILRQLKSGDLGFRFDFLLLGYFGPGTSTARTAFIDTNFVKTTILEFSESAREENGIWGTHAYVISNCGAKKMLAINDKVRFRADMPWNVFVKGIKLYATGYKFANQRGRANLQNDITERSGNIWAQ